MGGPVRTPARCIGPQILAVIMHACPPRPRQKHMSGHDSFGSWPLVRLTINAVSVWRKWGCADLYGAANSPVDPCQPIRRGPKSPVIMLGCSPFAE